MTTWSQVIKLEPLLPKLEDLQLGENQIVSINNVRADQFQQLKWINLENNNIQEWKDIESLGNLKRYIYSSGTDKLARNTSTSRV